MLKQRIFKRLVCSSATGILLLGSLPLQAMSLSTYRIYLDNDNSSASFVMFNKGTVEETCKLSLVHNNFDEAGQISKVDSAVVPENSAEPWIRFSPKNFTAAARTPQTVRFTLRRKANTQAEEYRSYLEVYCDTPSENLAKSEGNASQPIISVKPRLVQNVPIIVRTGKLEAEVSFSNFRMQGNSLEFSVTRKGNRSVYGTLELINKQTGKVINYRKNISIYTESTTVEKELSSSGIAADQLAVRFVEDKKYGGTFTHQQDVVLN